MVEERSLQKLPSGQYAIYLPAQVVRLLGWKKGDKIVITLNGQALRLEKKSD